MKIYIDTEFTDLVGDFKLISAGFVAEGGQELYFELTDNYNASECSDFVHQFVLPHLKPAECGMTREVALLKMKGWFQSFNEPVELCSDSIRHDFGLIQEMFKANDSWPENLSRTPVNVNIGQVESGIESYFADRLMAIRHHALWDAKALAYSVKAVESGVHFSEIDYYNYK